MISLPAFILSITLYIAFSGAMMYVLFSRFNNRSLHLLDIITYLIFNICIVAYLHYHRPKQRDDKYLPEYIEYGQSMNDAMFGRKYRYDTLLDNKHTK